MATLWGWYKFDGNANDSSGNGRNMTVTGTVDYVGCPTAKLGICGYFDGTNDYSVYSTSGPITNEADTFSITCWWRRGASASTDYLVTAMSYGTAAALHFGSTGADSIMLGFYGASGGYITTTVPSVFGWNQIGVIYNGTYNPANWAASMSFIVNGVVTAATAGSGTGEFWPLNVPAAVTHIDKKTGAKGQGYIHDLRIYTGQLTAAEVRTLYEQEYRGHSLSFGSL